MKATYIIIVEDMKWKHDGDYSPVMVFGSFRSYDKAVSYLPKVRKHYADDNRFWIGVRVVNPMRELE